jgi:hypothetical protein
MLAGTCLGAGKAVLLYSGQQTLQQLLQRISLHMRVLLGQLRIGQLSGTTCSRDALLSCQRLLYVTNDLAAADSGARKARHSCLLCSGKVGRPEHGGCPRRLTKDVIAFRK